MMATKLLREPLLHFLILGVLLFFAFNLANRRATPGTGKIVVTPGEIEHLEDTFTRAHQRPPDGRVISTIAPLPIPSRARVAKSVDARDLKSLGRNWPCRFESGSGHQLGSF